MLFYFYPAAFLFFIPIVAVEAWAAARVFKFELWQGVKLSFFANLFSTLLGVPLTWLLLLLVQIIFGGGTWRDLDLFWNRVYVVTLGAPWLFPYEAALNWIMPTAALVLSLFFFAASYWLEAWVVWRWVLKREVEIKRVRRWSLYANLCTYGVLWLYLAAGLIAGGS